LTLRDHDLRDLVRIAAILLLLTPQSSELFLIIFSVLRRRFLVKLAGKPGVFLGLSGHLHHELLILGIAELVVLDIRKGVIRQGSTTLILQLGLVVDLWKFRKQRRLFACD